ncbi:MAG: dTDP-4-dehydrorhamnose 3,5-epimerase [Planctomycetes bacterium]|nr:dTDP-4-dehydrorhamnose 3,5-epimerase [Planctomycetota bacterium]
MQVAPASIAGSFVIEPQAFPDARGYFLECWRADAYRAAGIDADFVQDNESCSSYGVVRGLHYQAGAAAQAKLVRVISGVVLDVAVDLRRGSPTFGRHAAVELSGDNRRQFFIPRGCAHGFAVLSEKAVFAYKCDNYYCPAAERGIRFDDPALGIDWRVPAGRAILSPKDLALPPFAQAELFD